MADAAPKALERLLQSGSVKLTGLFPEEEDQQAALKRARTIHRKAKENFEERGIETLMLGCGLATWENQKPTWDPRAQELLADGKVAPVIDRSYPLAEVPEAFRYFGEGNVQGKVVITV